MTDKTSRGATSGSISVVKAGKSEVSQPSLIPMSLFAAWDVDRTPPNCVPRLCSLTISRLTVLKPLGPDVTSITLAVKMQSSKRTLRSNEIALPVNGGQLLDTELELSFALQYPHYLKQWGEPGSAGNRLQVMLQRRKRYKNRTILGFKTICSGSVSMTAAIQRQTDVELELFSSSDPEPSSSTAPGTGMMGSAQKGSGGTNSNTGGHHNNNGSSIGPSAVLARVKVQGLSSQPVDHEEATERLKSLAAGLGDNPGSELRTTGAVFDTTFPRFLSRFDDAIDDEEEFTSNEDEDSDGRGGVGGRGHHQGGGGGATRTASGSSAKALLQNRAKMPPNARQRNLKQKFVALLKRFKITEDLQDLEEHEADEGCIDPSKLAGADADDLEMDAGDIEDLIDELEDLSDSGPEMDTLSVTSTPKPSLRPFFASSRSLLMAPDPNANAFIFPSSVDVEASSGRSVGLLERHYSDESSKRADSDSHAESMWTDQERESDTPTVSTSTQCPPPASTASTAHPTSETKDGQQRLSRLFNRPANSSAYSSGKKSQQQQQQLTNVASSSSVFSLSSKDQKSIESTQPRKILLEQLVRCMPPDDALPDHVIMVSGSDLQGCNLAGRLVERQQRAVCTGGAADVRATIACLVSKIQKFCNCSAKPPPPVKVVLIGGDSYVNSVLRSYVEQFSSKPSDWKNHLKFYIVPLCPVAIASSSSSSSSGSIGIGGSSHTLARYLATLDRYYNVNFLSDSWREALDRPADKMLMTNGSNGIPGTDGTPPPTKIDVQEVIHRLGRYLTSSGCTIQVPIAEAMITYCEPNSEEESTQVFIPFISEVRIGIAESSFLSTALGSLDIAETDGQQLGVVQSSSSGISGGGSPPQQSPLLTVSNSICVGSGSDKEPKEKDGKTRITPPSSPNISSIHANRESIGESVELQVDYWLSGSSAVAAAARENQASAAGGAIGLAATVAQAVKRETKSIPTEPSSVKYTVKAGFRWIVVQRLPNGSSFNASSSDSSSLFTMTFGLKEKKQKIMRLGKKKEKEKDAEAKSQVVEGISRLVCQAKTHHSLLKVVIDGVEWNNVKFFQLSSKWQTHIRHLPVALFTESVL